MTLTLYSIDHSLYCAKTRLVLRTKRLEWSELPPPEGVGSDAYLALVPTGNLPALVDGAMTLTDSEAIAEYLEETHPEPAMLPRDAKARAKCREISRFHDTRLEPALRLLFSNVAPKTRSEAEVEAAHREITKRLTALSHLLAASPLPRDTLWLSDCGLVITLDWISLFERHAVLPKLHWPAPIKTYLAQIHALPQVRAELAFYRPHMDDWLNFKIT